MGKTRYQVISLVVSVLTLVLVGLSGCVSSTEAPAPEATPSYSAPPETVPDIQRASARVVMEGGKVTNDVNFRVDTPCCSLYANWAGNITFYLDADLHDMSGESAQAAESITQTSFNSIITWEDLSPGSHTFAAQLITPASTPIEPHMHAGIDLEVPPPETDQPVINSLSVETLCRPGYTAPRMPGRPQQEGDRQACADINVNLDVLNFRVVDKIGEKTVFGEGHFIYYFNVVPPTSPGTPAFTEEGTYVATTDNIVSWFGVKPGEYSLWAQLVNNDNTPLEPPVVAGATIIVPVDAGRYLGY